MTEIKVNLHGYVAPSFGAYWLKRTGLAGRNLAEAITDLCIDKGLGVYALTSEQGGDGREHCEERGKYIFEQATKSRDYASAKLDDVAFAIRRRRDDKEVYFIEGQTLSVVEGDRKYEMLTFGSSSVPYGMNFHDTFAYLADHGLPVIPEHALSESAGGIGEESVIRYIDKFLALEHNAQMALPNFPFSSMPKFKDFTRAKNSRVMEIAEELGKPVVANDDSNWPSYMGAAYTVFDKDRLRFVSGRGLVDSIVHETLAWRAKPFLGHASTTDFLNWVGYELMLREKALGCKKRWERKHL